MSEDNRNITPPKQDEKQKKQERLAEALRANLRRRKSQSRARTQVEQTKMDES